MPLLGGMTVFVVAVGVLLLWLVFGGSTGKQRGLVVVNLRSTEVVLTLDDGQTAQIKPSESRTVFAIKADFPQTLRVRGTDGTTIFEERVDYKSLVDAEFRIAIADDRIVFPARPPGSQAQDANAQNACVKFAKWTKDSQDGVLSYSELRDKIKSMDGDAKDADSIAIRTASREVLAAITSGSQTSFDAAVAKMAQACLALP